MAKKIKIRTKKERVLLSDILPYETPATFSNRHFYDFLVTNKVTEEKLKDTTLITEPVLKILIDTFFGGNFKNIPFFFKISHKDNEFRELSICHPRNQIKIVEFYEKYKNLILYYCNLSPFSIRKPVRVGKYTFFNDKKHLRKLSKNSLLLEEFDSEYKNQKSYFVYKDFSNVHKFYESSKFHRSEKKYNHLLKLDITKCFDSIYTHSITWALMSKEAVKADAKATSFSNSTFAGEFDRLMQDSNHNETNGIIIGPEFSRIFAELILQAVDVAVEKKLRNENLIHKVNYEVFRYVDDYFVFYNDDQHKKLIVETLQHELKVYKLYLNTSKEENYNKPIITEITIAKNAIEKLLKEKLQFLIEVETPNYECPHPKGCETNPTECIKKPKGCVGLPTSKIHIPSKNLITEFKTIIKQTGVEYKDIINYTLMLIEGYSIEILESYDGKNGYLTKYEEYLSCKKHHLGPDELPLDVKDAFIKHKAYKEWQLIRSLIEIIEFTFFISSVVPRVNTTIRLSTITMLFVEFLNNRENINDLKHHVFKSISDNVTLILKKNKLNKHTQVETLYLLLILRELGKNYRLSAPSLMDYLGIEKDKAGELKPDFNFNYFSITVALTYIQNIKDYASIKDVIEEEIVLRFKAKKSMIHKDTELILLLLDTLTCPYVSHATKTTLLTIYDVGTTLHNKVINYRETWFTDWTGFNFNKELEAKRSREVY